MHYIAFCAIYLYSKSVIVTYLASLWLLGFVTEPLQLLFPCASLQVLFFMLIYMVNWLITLGVWFWFPDRSTEYLRLEVTHKNQANSLLLAGLPKPKPCGSDHHSDVL